MYSVFLTMGHGLKKFKFTVLDRFPMALFQTNTLRVIFSAVT